MPARVILVLNILINPALIPVLVPVRILLPLILPPSNSKIQLDGIVTLSVKVKSYRIIKIVLPQAKINVNLENKSVYKFLSTIKPNKMTYFLKEDFKLWDLHILKFFSEYKMFRQEVNKIICDKYINNEKNSNFNGKTKIKSKFYENGIKKNKNIYKKKLYFNKTKSNNDNINNKMQEKNFFFFFSQNINNINEGYFFQIIMPKIHVYFDYQNSLMNKLN